jgi:hypothetical protein
MTRSARRFLWFFLLPLAAAQTPAENYIAAGHWKRARALVEPRWGSQPNDPLANFLMSQIRFAFGDRESPLGLAEKAVTLDGRTSKFHRQLAEVLGVQAERANLLQQALLAHRFKREIDTAISLDGRDVQALRDLMEYYLIAPGIIGGDGAKAREIANRIAAIDPAEGFLAEARLGDADALRRAVEAAPGNYKARIALASFCLTGAHRDLPAAERHAREAIRIDPGRVAAYAILAEVYADRSQWSELDGVLIDAETAVPDDLVPYYRAAARCAARGVEAARAAQYLRMYMTQPPEGNEPALAEAEKTLRLR